jgi:curved DNA-binding protein CbpA
MSKAFATLGLPETATPDEVKAKWREEVILATSMRFARPT